MTDYLELAAGENADALWEATQELDLLPARREEGTSFETEMGEESLAELPLLEELQQVQRQLEDSRVETSGMVQTQGAGSAADRWERAMTVQSGADWTEGADGLPGQGTRRGQEEDLLLAQRIDRAFQRDSRRYDGGFFLY